MRTIPDMLWHDVCESSVKNFNGDNHYEICHNVYKGLAWYKKIFYLITQGRSYLDSVIDECVRERHDELR
tara:strand:+ start:62 stop:271 length:210 start_codon:yes stop_codon:yes gene_type:complete